MAVVALVSNGDRRIEALPSCLADVEHFDGHDGAEQSAAMRVSVEIIQQILSLLSPVDFNNARHTCRLWFFAGLHRSLLVSMLKRGGWWSSILRIISSMDAIVYSDFSDDALMSHWVTKECNMANTRTSAFVKAGYTDFRNLTRQTSSLVNVGALCFTVSQCGRFVMVANEERVYVYELNHGKRPESTTRRSFTVSARERHLALGLLRPVTSITCPRQVLACSMDTSSGRCAVAILMDGRMGMVCDIFPAKLGLSKYAVSATSTPSSGSNSPVTGEPSIATCTCNEAGSSIMSPDDSPRAIYRNLCQEDDPPRSVAICAQRDCVVFGCSASIELYWVDAISGKDFSRWFPFVSPSDFLYFLPARRKVDTAKKLRLISSAAGCDSFTVASSRQFHGYSTSLLRSGTTAIVSFVNDEGEHSSIHSGRVIMLPAQISVTRNVTTENLGENAENFIRRVSARTAEHYRAIPISDGYHILFTDPCTGQLGLGTDAPVGSSTRLFRKVWFRPPRNASNSTPVLYAAARYLDDGVRVVAVFDMMGSESKASGKSRQVNCQAIIFYTVPPDVFLRESFSETVLDRSKPKLRVELHSSKLVSYGYNEDDNGLVWPLQLDGQVIGADTNITEISIEADSDIVIWSFTADGFGTCRAVDTGENQSVQQREVKPDGSLDVVDPVYRIVQ